MSKPGRFDTIWGSMLSAMYIGLSLIAGRYYLWMYHDMHNPESVGGLAYPLVWFFILIVALCDSLLLIHWLLLWKFMKSFKKDKRTPAGVLITNHVILAILSLVIIGFGSWLLKLYLNS